VNVLGYEGSRAQSIYQKMACIFAIVVVVCSPTITVLLNDEYPNVRTLIFVLAGLAAMFACRRFSTACIVSIAAAFCGLLLFREPTKAVGCGVGVLVGSAALSNTNVLSRVVLVLCMAHLGLSLAQLLGTSEYVYDHVNYSNVDAVFESLDYRKTITPAYLPQIRPSGIFPAPTYPSLFMSLVLVVLAMKPSVKYLMAILIGATFAVAGSTFGVLAASVLLFAWRSYPKLRVIAYGYLATMVLYAIYLQELFDYNFNLDDLYYSLMSRADITQTEGESILVQSHAGTYILLLILLVTVLAYTRLSIIKLFDFPQVVFAIVIVLPAIVHNVSASMIYWFLVTVALNVLMKHKFADGIKFGPSDFRVGKSSHFSGFQP